MAKRAPRWECEICEELHLTKELAEACEVADKERQRAYEERSAFIKERSFLLPELITRIQEYVKEHPDAEIFAADDPETRLIGFCTENLVWYIPLPWLTEAIGEDGTHPEFKKHFTSSGARRNFANKLSEGEIFIS